LAIGLSSSGSPSNVHSDPVRGLVHSGDGLLRLCVSHRTADAAWMAACLCASSTSRPAMIR